MIKSTKFLILLFLFFYTAGCASFVVSDIPTSKIIHYSEPADRNKKNISFSVSYSSDVDKSYEKDIIENLKEKISQKFIESKLFSKVRYTENPENFEEQHFYFHAVLSGPSIVEQQNIGTMSGLTIMSIPVVSHYGIDISMHVTKKGTEVYSISAPQRIKDVLWLPFIVLSPFMNHLTIKNKIENNAVEYFLQEIKEQKLF